MSTHTTTNRCPDCETPNQFGELCEDCRAAYDARWGHEDDDTPDALFPAGDCAETEQSNAPSAAPEPVQPAGKGGR